MMNTVVKTTHQINERTNTCVPFPVPVGTVYPQQKITEEKNIPFRENFEQEKRAFDLI